MKTNPGNYLRGFRPRPGADPPRHAAHGHGGRCGALHGTLRLALRRAVDATPSPRAIGYPHAPGRRPARLPRRASARPCRTFRSTRWPISAMPIAASSRLSIRATRCDGLRGHRAQGELQRQDRRRRCRARTGTNQRGEEVLCLRALGDGQQARRGRAGAGRTSFPTLPEVGRPRSDSAAPCLRSIRSNYDDGLAGSPHRFERLRRRARRSTTSTA